MSVLTRSQRKQKEEEVSWNHLPNTAKLEIIQFLPLPDLKNFLLVSQYYGFMGLGNQLAT